MGRLTETQTAGLHELEARLPRAGDPRGFATTVLERLRTLVDCDSISYNEVDLAAQRNATVAAPFDALDGGDPGAFEHHLAQHPLIAYSSTTGDGSAHTISEFLSATEWKRTDLWNTYFHDVSVDCQLAICLALERDLVVGIAFNRERTDFDDADRDVLNVARFIVAASYHASRYEQYQREVVAAFDAALGRDDEGLIVTQKDGRVVAATTVADRLVSRYFGARVAVGTRLPGRLRDVSRGAVTSDLADGRLRVEAVPHEDRVVLVLRERHRIPQPTSPSAAITAREAEVLDLLGTGRSSSEVAHELGISGRTLDKHLEHIRAKLGVSSRAAAVARWLTS